MKTLLFTLEYPPQIGGVADYYGNLVAAWQPSGLRRLLSGDVHLCPGSVKTAACMELFGASGESGHIAGDRPSSSAIS